MIDIHTHILPGIDDGAKDWDMTLEMLKRSADAGVKKIIATPHYLPWRKNVPAGTVKQLCDEAMKKLHNKYGIVMDIYPGNEIYYNLGVIQKLKDAKALTLAGSRYVLIEFSTKTTYQMCRRAVREISDSGYIPVIAHVERYGCLRSFAKLNELRQMGALIQMNTDSIRIGFPGGLGFWTGRCLSNRMVDFLGSDMHDLNKRSPYTEKRLQRLRKKLEPEYQKELLYENAQKVLDDTRI